MPKYHIHIPVDNFEDVEKELQELAYILTGMREWQKKWKAEYGANNRVQKEKWEARADDWIKRHKIKLDE